MSGLRWIARLALGLVVAVTVGCQVPSVPDHVRSNPYFQHTEEEEGGWLFDRLMGRQEARRQPASGVRQASAEEPIYPTQAPLRENITQALAASEKPEKEGFQLSDLAPERLFGKAKEIAGFGPDEDLARQLFDEGQELYREKKYAQAVEKFKSAAFRWPDSPLEEDALFYRAESLYFAQQYAAARDAFDELMKKYENSRYLDRAVRRQFAIGRYWEQAHRASPTWPIVPNVTDDRRPAFDTWGHAIKAYESVRMNDPTGPLADDAIMATANAYFVQKRYEDAAYHYDLVRKEYPRSEHQYDAHRLGMKAKQLMYQGPMYDGTPLEEAAEVADQTLRQFRGELGPDRRRIIEEKNRIVAQQAEREWAMGQYYEKKGYNAAARFYYQSLVDNASFARTGYVEKARERLAAIQGKPDRPPDYFQWLDRLFEPGEG